MTQPNPTKNQHYVSQAELRLNAANPAAQRSNQRIFAFEVIDRENGTMKVRNAKGEKIAKTLSALDLFSFDVLDESIRHNLEVQFGRYEADIEQHTHALLQKLEDGSMEIKKELLEIFAAKFLNFLRNPNCVRKVLNSVGQLPGYHPTDPDIKKLYRRIDEGNKPHEAEICRRFALSETDYRRWLRSLFLILVRLPNSNMNFFEAMIKELFEKNFVMVQVHHYKKAGEHDVALLSDRGFNMPLQQDSVIGFDFNIASAAFACFVFCDPARTIPGPAKAVADQLRGDVRVSYTANDLRALARYNQLTIYQCAAIVYGSSASPRLTAE